MKGQGKIIGQPHFKVKLTKNAKILLFCYISSCFNVYDVLLTIYKAGGGPSTERHFLWEISSVTPCIFSAFQ